MTPEAAAAATAGLRSAGAKDVPLEVGTEAFYQNTALGIQGWGVIVEPVKDDYLEPDDIGLLYAWEGTLTGPEDPLQVALDQLAPGCAALPGSRRMVVPRYLLWVRA